MLVTDPYELKPPDVYAQAKLVASKTTRGRDAHWYKAPCDCPFQWHIWFDGGREVRSATYSRHDGSWRQGPSLPLAILTTFEGIDTLFGELLSPTYFGQRPKAIGIIYHVCDEFALSEIAPYDDLSGDGAERFSFLRYNLVDAPLDVLADNEVSENQTSWRLLPFWGALPNQPTGVAMALPRAREKFLNKLVEKGEEANVPVRVAVTCGPLEALASLAILHPNLPSPNGCLIAIPYLKFTALFALSNSGELRAARSLLHRGDRLVPNDFGHIVWNMAMGAELVGNDNTQESASPHILIMSTEPQALEQVSLELQAFAGARHPIMQKLFDLNTLLQEHSGNRPEFVVYDPAAQKELATTLANSDLNSQTFRALWDGWASQNFYNTEHVDRNYPSKTDLQILRLSTWLNFLLVALTVSLFAWGATSLWQAMRHPSWKLTQDQVNSTKGKNEALIKERQKIENTALLLQPRSQGWSTMEVFLQMFPENAKVRLETFDYKIESASPTSSDNAKTVGLIRRWTFTGLAKPQAMQDLHEFTSQQKLTVFFNRLAKQTGDPVYSLEPTRSLNFTVKESRNPTFDPQSNPAEQAQAPSIGFPFSFEAVITQTLSHDDPYALPTTIPL